MHNSKLISLLKTFRPEELKQLHQFLKSPIFNTNKSLILFYEYIRKSAPTYEDKRLSKEKVFKYLYPKKTYRILKIQQLMSDLVKNIEQFWAFQRWEKQTLSQDLAIASTYYERGFRNYWQKQVADLRTALSEGNKEKEAAVIAFEQLQLEVNIHELIEAEENRNQEPHLQAVSNSLDHYFMLNKLKYYCKALNFQHFTPTDYDFDLMEAIMELVETKWDTWAPAIQIYFYLAKALSTSIHEGEEAFQAVKQLLRSNGKQLHAAEGITMLILARNYCIRQINAGNSDYLKETFELYKIELEEYIIDNKQSLSPHTYKNISTVASLLQEYDWLEKFLNDYKNAVELPIYQFNLAQLKFRQKKYEAVIPYVLQPDHKDLLLQLASKALLLKTYYELQLQKPDQPRYYDLLEQYITNFAAFLNRKKVQLPKHYIFYSNFIKYFKLLLFKGHFYKDTPAAAEKIFNQMVDKQEQVAEKVWLRKKFYTFLGNK